MGRFVEGQDRRQSWLLPSSLDDYVTADNPVRVVEVFIDELDLEQHPIMLDHMRRSLRRRDTGGIRLA